MIFDFLPGTADYEEVFIKLLHNPPNAPFACGRWRCQECARPIAGRIWAIHFWEDWDGPTGETAEYYGCLCYPCFRAIYVGLTELGLWSAWHVGYIADPFRWGPETITKWVAELRITPWAEGETKPGG